MTTSALTVAVRNCGTMTRQYMRTVLAPSTRMVREAYANQNWAYGSTIAVVLFVMALCIVAPYIYSQYQRGEL